MSKNNPYSLVVTVENSTCVVEFDVTVGEIDWETIEVFYNKKFKKGAYQKYVAEEWTQVNDLIHDKTWKSIEDQIKAQWDDVEEQQSSYDEALEYYQAAGLATTRVAKSITALREALASEAIEQPAQYRSTGWAAHRDQYAVPVLFSPYTGEPRDVRDVQSDPQGILIVPPGKVEMRAAKQTHHTEQHLEMVQPAQPQQEPEYKGWYCAHCQRGVDGSEVTHHEQHTVCGRVITDDLPPKPQQEPVAQEWRYYFSHSGATGKPDEVVGPCFTDRKEVAFGVGCFDQTALCPPASKPLTDEQREKLRDAFAQSLTSVYVCGRVWEAWQYGTMSEGDFQPASECEEVLEALIEAAHGIKE